MSQKRVFNTNAEHIYVNDVPEYNLDLVNARSIDPAYSFTRNSAATYVGPDGLIKTAGINQPRFEYDPMTGECKGLLVEESRINYQPYSQQVGGTSWSSTGYIVELNTQDTKDPSGNYSASKITDNGGTYITGVGNISGFNQWSIFAKAGNSSIFQIRSNNNYNWVVINITTKTVTNFNSPIYTSVEFIDYPNGWVRVLYTGSTSGAYVFRLSTIGDYLYFWGAQAETASSHSSYIPTTSSAVTRQPDQLVLNKTLNTQGTFFIESNPTQGVPLVAGDASLTLSILQPTNQYTKSVLYYNNNRTLRMASDDSVPTEVNGLTPRIINKISLGYSISYINGYLKKFSYYSSPLSEDNLRALTGNPVPVSRATTAGNVFALGGTVTEITQNGLIYRVHTFTTVGTSELIIENGGLVEYLIVGGGGGGGTGATNTGGGGGAGGFRTGFFTAAASVYPVVVGAGGAARENGNPSSIFSIESAGGGKGRDTTAAGSGGSGGGSKRDGGTGGAGNTPPTSPAQGFAGGNTPIGPWQGGSGGGGAGGVGLNGGGSESGSPSTEFAGSGGPGAPSSITGTEVYYAGGGGGANAGNEAADKTGFGGIGGGGRGRSRSIAATSGAPNTGGGGGGAETTQGSASPPGAGAGGSGIVIVRYPIGVA